jgi:hypothetical protein
MMTFILPFSLLFIFMVENVEKSSNVPGFAAHAYGKFQKTGPFPLFCSNQSPVWTSYMYISLPATLRVHTLDDLLFLG